MTEYNTTPVVTDNVSVIALQTIAKGATPVRATLDLSTKYGAWLYAQFGRTGVTAISSAINIHALAMVNGSTIRFPLGMLTAVGLFQSSTTACNGNTTVDQNSASGQNILYVASTTNFAVGDVIFIQDAGGGLTRCEWNIVSAIATNDYLTLAAPLQYTHTQAQADTVRNKADSYQRTFISGGAVYEVIVDYAGQTTGDSIVVRILAQTYDGDLTQ